MNEIWHSRARSQCDWDTSGVLYSYQLLVLIPLLLQTHQTFNQFCSPSHGFDPLEEFFSPLHTLLDEFFNSKFLQDVGEMRENVFCSDTLGFAHDTGFDVPGHCVAVPTENCIFEILLVALTRKSGLRPTGHFCVDPLDNQVSKMEPGRDVVERRTSESLE